MYAYATLWFSVLHADLKPMSSSKLTEWDRALAAVDPRTAETVARLAYSMFSRKVFRTANRLVANPADAEDITQDVFVLFHQKYDEFDEPKLHALPGWLMNAANKMSLKRASKRRLHSDKLEELAQMREQASGSHDPQETVALLVKELLSLLPRKHRFVAIRKYGYGEKHATIAKQLGIDIATVTRWLKAVNLALRKAHPPTAHAMLGLQHGRSQ